LIGVLVYIVFINDGILKNNTKNVSIKKEESNITPEAVLNEYMAYINTKDYDKMYELLSEQSKQFITKDAFIVRNKKIYEGIEARNIAIKITEVQAEAGSAIVNYETNMDTIAGKLQFMNGVALSKNKKNEYCIEWGSETIYPELTDQDKIKITSIKGKRGDILDRNGTVLAGVGTVASVGLVPGKMGENSNEDIKKIAGLLLMTKEDIQKKLEASYVKPDSFVPLKTISQEKTKLKKKLLQISGVMITDKEVRAYPLGEKAAHLTGYVQNINQEELKELGTEYYNQNSIIGKSGLEKLLEERIRGIDGWEINIVDERGNIKETIGTKPEQDGENVKITIDSALQSKLYDQLKEDKSSSVVMNPKTGEILALVSTPAYDPNEFILGMSSDRWQELNNDEDKPMYNRFKATLCPGSSFKPVIAAIGLTTGKLNPNENFGNSGLSWQKDAGWGNYKVTTLHEYGDKVNMQNALIYSDNIYFAKAALKIGKETLSEELLNIGFDESIPFLFGLATSEFGTNNEFDTEIQLADSGYGQGKILVNPIHLASIYSAFVNDGNMIKPYLEYKDTTSPEYWKMAVFSESAAETVLDDLIQVVENPNGTGHKAKIDGLTIAGKTGTAEIKQSKEDTKGTELGWFNAVMVSDQKDKQYLAVCMVEDVKERGGSHFVIPIVKSVFEDCITAP
jgi:penicillin-binding protein